MCTHLDKTGSIYYFRRPVPRDLIGHFSTATGQPRKEWKFSLRTKDREEAKRLKRPHEEETDELIDEARAALDVLGQPKADAETSEREREEQAAAEALAAESSARRGTRGDLRTLWRQRRQTSTAMLTPEEAAAVDLIRERDAEIEQLLAAVEVLQAGNERLGLPRLRATSGTGTTEASRRPVVSLSALFVDYAKSGAATAHTIAKWRAAINVLIEYLGHDDAAAVTRADVTGWLKSLVAGGLSVSTVKGTYRAATARVLKLAHSDGLLAENVAAGIEVRGPKANKIKRSDLSDQEALLILGAALEPQPEGIGAHHALARRWAPWICAYTGARIAEVTQMRACDILQDTGVWMFRITPEAGSVKNRKLRLVPVHSHLIEQGVLAFAKANDLTPLFYDPGAARKLDTVQKQPQQMGSKLAKWVRELGVTEVAMPNHGWRHRFKTVARSVGIPADVSDAIQGHVARTEGENYGGQPLAILQAAIELVPRYEMGRKVAP